MADGPWTQYEKPAAPAASAPASGPWEQYKTAGAADAAPEPAAEPEQQTAMPYRPARGPAQKGNGNAGAVQFFQDAAGGAIKAVGGMVQTAADTLLSDPPGVKDGPANRLSMGIAKLTDAAATAVGARDGTTPGGVIGGALPFVLGGESLMGEKLLAKGAGLATKLVGHAVSGALAAGTELQSGATANDRNSNRMSDAAVGALFAPVGLASDAAGKAVTKIANSKALSKVLNSLHDQIENWKPSAADVAKDVGSRFTAMNQQFQIATARLDRQVATRGGVEMGPMAPVVKDARATLEKITTKDPSKPMLGQALAVLRDAVPQEGKDFRTVVDSIGGEQNLTPALRQQFTKQGFQLDPVIPPGKFGQMAQLSRQIDDHLTLLGAKVDTQAGLALQKIKGALDDQLSAAVEPSPTSTKIWNGIKSDYYAQVKPLKEKGLAGFLSPDPGEQLDAAHNLLNSGDKAAAGVLSKMVNKAGRDQMVRLAVHQGVVDSFDKGTQTIDASKLQDYFKDPGRQVVLKPFMTRENTKELLGVQNFIQGDAHAKPGKGFFGNSPGSWATTVGFYGGVHAFLGGALHGDVTLMPIGEALATAGIMKGMTKGVDHLMGNSIGRNFFNALSEVTPGTPKWDKTIEAWRPRITRLLSTTMAQGAASGQQQVANAPAIPGFQAPTLPLAPGQPPPGQ